MVEVVEEAITSKPFSSELESAAFVVKAEEEDGLVVDVDVAVDEDEETFVRIAVVDSVKLVEEGIKGTELRRNILLRRLFFFFKFFFFKNPQIMSSSKKRNGTPLTAPPKGILKHDSSFEKPKKFVHK